MKKILFRFTVAVVVLPSVAQSQIEIVNAFPHLSFTKPLDLQHAGDGSNRLFVVEQEGRIRVFLNDSSTSSSKIFLDIADSVYYVASTEMGLLGLAFHPEYETNGYFFIHYTKNNPRRSVIARHTVSNNPDSANRSAETILLEVNQPYSNHNGGQLAFGPDGFLYIGLGDGGSGGDPQNNAQTLTTLLGKILRIDIDAPTGELLYGIPPGNPFAGNQMGYREEIFAFGLRNPWRFSFDPVSQQLWCGDVGQSSREEINLIENGGNYGWRIMEGTECYDPPSDCTMEGLILPVWDYPREFGGSITGGFVYRGPPMDMLRGKYIFGDYLSGSVAALDYDGINAPTVAELGSLPPYFLTSFGTDESGELYLCSFGGSILRFRPAQTSSVLAAGSPEIPLLHQSYPNPFNSTTRIVFFLPTAGRVSLKIFDQVGREIGTLIDDDIPRGEHAVEWHAKRLSSGLYFYRIVHFDSGLVRTKAMLLIR